MIQKPVKILMESSSNAHQKRSIIHRWSLIIGNLLEHFDSSLYGFLAPVLGKVFFPQFSPLYQIILAFSVYLITFVARPFGGIFFSKLTYGYGPLRVLSWSLMGVALATGLMGLLPTAKEIGVFAPLLLVVVRFIQSFCAAGESAIAGYYLIDNVTEKKQMSWSGFYHSSTLLGILLASSISSYVLLATENHALWRIPFLLGFFLGIWAIWMRLHYREASSPMDSCFSLSYKDIFSHIRNNSKLVLSLIPIYGFSYVTYSVPFVFLNPYLNQTTEIPLSTLLMQTNSLFWLDAILLPCVALLINRFNFVFSLLSSSIIFMIGICCLLLFLPYLSITTIFLLRLVLVIAGIGFCTSLIPWTNKLLPPSDKYLFHSVSYNMGSELFGRSTPFICFWIYAIIEKPASPLIYILGLSIFSFVLVLLLSYLPSRVSQLSFQNT